MKRASKQIQRTNGSYCLWCNRAINARIFWVRNSPLYGLNSITHSRQWGRRKRTKTKQETQQGRGRKYKNTRRVRQRQTMQLLFPLSFSPSLLSARSCSLWAGGIPQCAQDVPAIWRPLRVVSASASGGGSKPSAALKHVSVSCGSQSTRNCNATRTHSTLSL